VTSEKKNAEKGLWYATRRSLKKRKDREDTIPILSVSYSLSAVE
jgi:hypothetical protein